MQDEKSAVPAVKEQCDAATPEEKRNNHVIEMALDISGHHN